MTEEVKFERRKRRRMQYKIIEVTEGNLNGMNYEIYSRCWTTLFLWVPLKGAWNFATKEQAIERIKQVQAAGASKRKEVWRG